LGKTGSDYPFESANDMTEFVNEFPLKGSEREALNWENAEKLGVSI